MTDRLIPITGSTGTARWRPIVGFENLYEISDLGSVRRLAGTPQCRDTRLLKTRIRGPGYFMVQLYKDNRHHLRYVHRLIAESFIGPPNGLSVNHRDGNKLNNALSNLEYTTLAENTRHGFANGLIPPKAKRFHDAILVCSRCSTKFTVEAGRFRARVKETGQPPLFCSQSCYHLYPRSNETREKISRGNKKAWANGR